jgi:hypothetical protein
MSTSYKGTEEHHVIYSTLALIHKVLSMMYSSI